MKILLADDEPTIRLSLVDALEDMGHHVVAAADGQQAADALQQEGFDVLVSDIRMPKVDGMTLFRQAKQRLPIDVILMTAYAEVSDAVAALKEGAMDYLMKPFDVEELRIRIQRIQERRNLESQLERAREELSQQDPTRMVVGESPAMSRLTRLVETVADSEAPVLISGESGTGKELVARTLHRLSPRSEGPFVAVNCAAFPETLLEAELFGHEKGAFTGAHQTREGRFEAARGGTLFLDEVAEIPMTAQAKLLRVLQDGMFEPLGTNRSVQSDVRIVSATHRNLKARMAEGQFREDLFYRLNVLDLQIPALRERRSDLPLLVEHFLAKHSRAGREPPGVSPAAFAALSEYAFPGNVRELEHAIHRAVVLSRGETIELEHLPESVAGQVARSPEAAQMAAPSGVQPLNEAMRSFEREYLQRALRATEGKKSKAADLLGISRKNLWEKLKAHQLNEPA